MRSRIFDLIVIDEYSATPKYLQLVNSIINAIQVGKIKKDDLMPSINELTYEYNISNVTAQKGYNHLKKIGVLKSVIGKGFFIRSVEVKETMKIFLLFNKLSTHKKFIYDSFVEVLGDRASVDFYIYNNDFSLFKKLILSRDPEEYTYFVIIPHFLEEGISAHGVLNSIPKEKLVLLSKRLPGVTGKFAAVYENFENDIYSALEQALDLLNKYTTIKIIFPEYTYHPKEIIQGFNRFCVDHAFNGKVVRDVIIEPIAEGEVFISLMENDMITLIERVLSLGLEVGKQVGIISYNETPIKKIILNGITTISSDFHQMGAMAARLILNDSKEELDVPFALTLRSSL